MSDAAIHVTTPAVFAEPPLLLPLPGGEMAVAGLIWRPLTSHDSVNNQTKKLLLQQHCRYFVVHQAGEQLQCGLAATLPSQYRYYSVALLLLELLGNDWVAILPWQAERYLLIGAKAGQIVPGCDVVLPSAAAAIQHFEAYQPLVNWQAIYAPANLQLSDQALELAPLLESCSSQRAYRLHYFYATPQNTRWLLLSGGLLLLLLTLSYLGWRYHQHQQAVIRLAAQRFQAAQQQRKKHQLAAANPTPKPWLEQPAAAELLQQCLDSMHRHPLLLGGWQLVASRCSTQGAEAEYRRLPLSSPQDFITAASQRDAHHYHLASTNIAHLRQPVAVTQRSVTDQPQPLLPFVSAVLRKIELGMAQGRIDDIVANPSQSAHFELTSMSAPKQLFNDLPLTGVVIHTLSHTVSEEGVLLWKISGTVYGPQPPL